MKDRVNHLNHEYMNLTEVGNRIEVAQYMIRSLEAGQDIILIAELIMVAMHEAIRGMQEIIIIIEGMIIEIEFMIGIGVGHLKDRIEVGEMIEV